MSGFGYRDISIDELRRGKKMEVKKDERMKLEGRWWRIKPHHSHVTKRNVRAWRSGKCAKLEWETGEAKWGREMKKWRKDWMIEMPIVLKIMRSTYLYTQVWRRRKLWSQSSWGAYHVWLANNQGTQLALNLNRQLGWLGAHTLPQPRASVPKKQPQSGILIMFCILVCSQRCLWHKMDGKTASSNRRHNGHTSGWYTLLAQLALT